MDKRRRDSKGRLLQVGESQRKDGRYMFRYVDASGRRGTEYSWRLVETDSHPAGKKAELSLREKKKYINRATEDFVSFQAGKMTLNELFDTNMEMKHTTKKITTDTYNNYYGTWNKHVRKQNVANMTITNIRKSNILLMYRTMMNNGAGKGAVKLIHKIISALLNFAVAEDYIRKNYAKGCDRELELYTEEREALTIEQQNIFLKFVAKTKRYAKSYWLFVFLIETACRGGEMAGLTFHDVDMDKRMFNIDHQLSYTTYEKGSNKRKFVISTPKTRKSIRDIPLSQQAYKALIRQKELLFREGLIENFMVDECKNFIFLSPNNKLWSVGNLDDYLGRIVDSYNAQESEAAENEGREMVLLPKITAHILRHTGCTRMAEDGMDMRTLQDIMGHDSISITQKVYNHVDTIRLRKEMDRLDAMREKLLS